MARSVPDLQGDFVLIEGGSEPRAAFTAAVYRERAIASPTGAARAYTVTPLLVCEDARTVFMAPGVCHWSCAPLGGADWCVVPFTYCVPTARFVEAASGWLPGSYRVESQARRDAFAEACGLARQRFAERRHAFLEAVGDALPADLVQTVLEHATPPECRAWAGGEEQAAKGRRAFIVAHLGPAALEAIMTGAV